MSLSRWKMMAGVLGVSIGGLAAAASQCPKLDKTKGRQPEAPVTAEAPKVAPAGAPTGPTTTPPALPVPGPAAPQLAPAGATPAPELPKVPTPDAGKVPAIPDLTPAAALEPAKPETKPEAKPADPTTNALPAPPALPGLPVPDSKGAPAKATPPADAPKAVPMPPAPAGDPLPPLPSKPVGSPEPATKPLPAPPANVTPVGGTSTSAPPAVAPSAPPALGVPSGNAGAPPLPIEIDVPPTKGPATAAAPAAAPKFRILLRVGEGEPTFEVKHGDDLVMKVACEKVDIKSPEKGQGLSAVTAKGKVRFAGFGAEGTCDELSFMAGTGEVSMSGEVKVQVKDKLGRVESELTTATLKYKIDASAVGNTIKPEGEVDRLCLGRASGPLRDSLAAARPPCFFSVPVAAGIIAPLASPRRFA
ncbi:MAG: hypothetical protein ACKODX_20280 [Gemmata sp.]